MSVTANETIQPVGGPIQSDQIGIPAASDTKLTHMTENPALEIPSTLEGYIQPHNPDHGAQVAATQIEVATGIAPGIGSATMHGDGSGVVLGDNGSSQIQNIPIEPGSNVWEETREFFLGTIALLGSQIFPDHESETYNKSLEARHNEIKRRNQAIKQN